jgi:hypothetical protein
MSKKLGFSHWTPTGSFHSSNKDTNGDRLFPYGMVVNVLLDESGKFSALELQYIATW